MTVEHEMRLQDILHGPWHEQSHLAREQVPALSHDQAARVFRSHYVEPIHNEDEIGLRESFDQVLEQLQLLELAVASGYLPLESVRDAARRDFDTLICSPGARTYISIYDFVPVRFLAARLGVDLGLAPVTPPEVNPGAALRYAAFLAVHADFTATQAVVRFTMLMDDYRFRGTVDAPFFLRAMQGSPALSDVEQSVVQELRMGLVQFVTLLGDLFLLLEDDEKALYGCIYAYWLSHFFGVRRTGTGYEEEGVSFEEVWRNPELVASGLDDAAQEAEHQRLAVRISTLRATWAHTRALIESLECSEQPQAAPDVLAERTDSL